MRNKLDSRHRMLMIFFWVAVLCLVVLFVKVTFPAVGDWWDTRGLSEDQIALRKLSHILRISPDDPPKVTTVSDVAKLRGQNFFRYAENGDKVFIFNMSQKAVLFRPSTGFIVDIAPIRMVK